MLNPTIGTSLLGAIALERLLLFLVLSAAAATDDDAAAPRANQELKTSPRCQTRLAADFGTLGKGADVVRRLYPRFEEQTFVLKGKTTLSLVDCDLAKRPPPATGVAVLLTFPRDWYARGDMEGPAHDTWADDRYRFEVAVISVDDAGKPAILRNEDSFPHPSMLEPDGSSPLPLDTDMQLDRAVFRLDEKEIAVGVLFGSSDPCSGSNTLLYERRSIALFRASPSGLARVFLAPLQETATPVHCENDEDCGTGSEQKYIVRISKQKTSGFFDLIYNARNGRRKDAVIYQWNGSQYQPGTAATKAK